MSENPMTTWARFLGMGVLVLFAGYYQAWKQQRREPDPAKRPGWVQALESWGVLPERPLPLDPEAREGDAVASRRVPPSRTASPESFTDPLASVIRQAATEGNLAHVNVLGVSCEPEEPCIVYGSGTKGPEDIEIIANTSVFKEALGDSTVRARSAVHWPSDWEDEEAFFAISIHPRDERIEEYRARFRNRVEHLRRAHEGDE